MKIRKIWIDDYQDTISMNVAFEKGQTNALYRLLDGIGTIDPQKDYDVSIKPKKKKRTLDANAYFWTLLGKLGDALKQSDMDLYRQYIRDTGAFQIIPIREDLIQHWEKIWGAKGLGWLCEDLGECRMHKGYHNIKSYYGTSAYDSKEMAKLIDLVVDDCKTQGIETLPPTELNRIKEMWGGG